MFLCIYMFCMFIPWSNLYFFFPWSNLFLFLNFLKGNILLPVPTVPLYCEDLETFENRMNKNVRKIAL